MNEPSSYVNVSDFLNYPDLPETVPAHDKKRDALTRVLKLLIIVLSVFLLGELLYYVCVIPAAAVPLVTVSGLQTAVRDDVYAYTDGMLEKSWLDINSSELSAAISCCPLFASVDVVKIFPDKVVVTVVERTAAAVALIQCKGRTVPVQIDSSGVLFKMGTESLPENCIMLSGIDFDDPTLGSRLHPMLRPLLTDIATAEKICPELCDMISEIKIDLKAYGGFDLIVYPSHKNIRLRTKGQLNVELLKYMMLVLDVAANFHIDTDELDFRAGTVSYQLRGGIRE